MGVQSNNVRSSNQVRLFLQYDGHQEIVSATRHYYANTGPGMPLKTNHDGLKALKENLVSNMGKPVDFIIRTSTNFFNEGFLLWQSSESEYWFHKGLWPFTKKSFYKALADYAVRERRFGK